MRRFLSVCAVLAVLVGCGGGGGGGADGPITAAGSWEGFFTPSSMHKQRLALVDLAEEPTADETRPGVQVVSGIGSLKPANADTPLIFLTVEGERPNEADVALVLSADGYQDVLFSGHFDGPNRINALLGGSGFVAEAVTMKRID